MIAPDRSHARAVNSDDFPEARPARCAAMCYTQFSIVSPGTL